MFITHDALNSVCLTHTVHVILTDLVWVAGQEDEKYMCWNSPVAFV